MAIQTEELKRIFKFKDLELDDPNEKMSKEEVLDFYSGQYPELVNAHVTNPKIENDTIVYEFLTSIGTKG